MSSPSTTQFYTLTDQIEAQKNHIEALQFSEAQLKQQHLDLATKNGQIRWDDTASQETKDEVSAKMKKVGKQLVLKKLEVSRSTRILRNMEEQEKERIRRAAGDPAFTTLLDQQIKEAEEHLESIHTKEAKMWTEYMSKAMRLCRQSKNDNTEEQAAQEAEEEESPSIPLLLENLEQMRLEVKEATETLRKLRVQKQDQIKHSAAAMADSLEDQISAAEDRLKKLNITEIKIMERYQLVLEQNGLLQEPEDGNPGATGIRRPGEIQDESVREEIKQMEWDLELVRREGPDALGCLRDLLLQQRDALKKALEEETEE